MGKYRREQRMAQAEKEKNERKKIIAGALAVLAAGGGIVGYAGYKNYNELHGPYCKIGDHELSRIEYDFFYNSSVNNFVSTYQSYLPYIGLDTTKDFSEQNYSEDKTWEQFFQEEAVTLMSEVYTLVDLANENGFKSNGKSMDEFLDSITAKAKELDMTTDEYIRAMYGSKATRKNLKSVMKDYYLAVDYAAELQDTVFVPTDDEIESYYSEHRDDYDVVQYRLFRVDADPSKLGQEETTPEDTTVEETTQATETPDSPSEENKEETVETVEEPEKPNANLTDTTESTEDGNKSSQAEPPVDTETILSQMESTDKAVSEGEDKTSQVAPPVDSGTILSETGSTVEEAVEGSEQASEQTETQSEQTVDTTDSPQPTYTDEQWADAMEKAGKTAEEFYEQVYDEETFKELCIKYAPDEESKEYYEAHDGSLHMNYNKSSIEPAVADWLMDSARVVNHTAIIKDNDNHCYYIVFFKGRIRDDTPTRNVRHILIQPEEVEEPAENADAAAIAEHEKAHEEAKTKAKAEAERILEEWKNGEATEESFAKLAEQYSSDSAEGGLYENVAEGEMVEAFDNWLFAEDRKEGDVEIVETEYGYHIMYMVGFSDPTWKINARNAIIGEKYIELVNSRMQNMVFEDVKGELEYLVTYQKQVNEQNAAKEETTSQQTSEEEPKNETNAPVPYSELKDNKEAKPEEPVKEEVEDTSEGDAEKTSDKNTNATPPADISEILDKEKTDNN